MKWVVIAVLVLMPSLAKGADNILDLAVKIVICESSGRNDAVGDDGISRGLSQFRKETFYEFAHMAGYKNARWDNAVDQWNLLIWGLKHGYAKRWTCSDIKVRERQKKRQAEKKGKTWQAE